MIQGMQAHVGEGQTKVGEVKSTALTWFLMLSNVDPHQLLTNHDPYQPAGARVRIFKMFKNVYFLGVNIQIGKGTYGLVFEVNIYKSSKRSKKDVSIKRCL